MTVPTFPAPEAERPRPRIQPVFIPFQGCATRCIFCAQSLQTGETPRGIRETLAALEAGLSRAADKGEPPRELAFYGGTFTALPEKDQFACLELAARFRERGLVSAVRASTRPDAVTAPLLTALRQVGLDMLELGVQSFTDTALSAANRGYTGETAARACGLVRESGLVLGIQLMPGMPGMREDDFRRDLAQTLAQAPAAVRLYPCLVLAGTELAALYQRGAFVPWSLEETVPLLAEAQGAFWRAGVAVIRIGLAPQTELDQGGILAGPRHPALGSMVRGLALFHYIAEQVSRLERPITGLALPRRFQGDFWGHRGELKEAYAALGLSPANVTWHDVPYCALY